MWCPSGPCTQNSGNRCEPKNWLTAVGGSQFEECGEQGIQSKHFKMINLIRHLILPIKKSVYFMLHI